MTILLFLFSYVRLKWQHPTKSWIYGKSWFWAFMLSIPPAAGTIATIYFTLEGDTTTLGIPHINLVSLCTILGIGFLMHLVVIIWQKSCGHKSAERKRLLSVLSDEVDDPVVRLND